MKQDYIRTEQSKKTIERNKIIEIIDYLLRLYDKQVAQEKISKNIQLSNCETVEEIKELLEYITEDIINIFYNIETAILKDGFIPLEYGAEILAFKALHSLCKTILALPDTDLIVFPECFIEEYTSLLSRVNQAINSVSLRIRNLNNISEGNPIGTLLEKNLLILKMLRLHYISSLGLSYEENSV